MKRFLSIFLILVLVISLFSMTGCSKDNDPAPEQPDGVETDAGAESEADKVSFEGKTLDLFVAAGMKKPMDRVIEIFKDETGADVAVNYGPSGGLYAQIEQGQPCDLYYSADWIYIEKIEEDGKLEKEDKFLTDNIVVVVSDTGKEKVQTIDDLTKDEVVSVIADPQAPVGVYAKNSLENLELWDKVSPNIKAMPSTVNQVAIMVKEDQVDAGLIYSSVANGNELDIVDVVDHEYSGEIIFGTATIKGGQIELADAFAEIATKHVDIFEEYGWKSYE